MYSTELIDILFQKTSSETVPYEPVQSIGVFQIKASVNVVTVYSLKNMHEVLVWFSFVAVMLSGPSDLPMQG